MGSASLLGKQAQAKTCAILPRSRAVCNNAQQWYQHLIRCLVWLQVAYNLIYSLGQHTYDTDCNLFLRVSAAVAPCPLHLLPRACCACHCKVQHVHPCNLVLRK